MAVPAGISVFQAVYLSHILKRVVLAHDGSRLGRLEDIFLARADSPRIVAFRLRTAKGQIGTYDWSQVTFVEEDRHYFLRVRDLRPVALGESMVGLARQILDQQIIDINDRKVVRVNDIRLASLSGGVYAVAVDVGFSGFLRRLGVVESVNSFLQLFGRSVPGRLILWGDIGVLVGPGKKIKLSVGLDKLSRLHPVDLSAIIEDLDGRMRAVVFDALDEERAADVLEEMKDDTKVSLVEDLPVEKAADVLEKMPSDEAADILGDLASDKAQELLNEMDQQVSEQVREILEYPEDSIGAIMSTDFVTFRADRDVTQTLEDLRALRPDEKRAQRIFVVDANDRPIGILTLAALVGAAPQAQLSEIMNKTVHLAQDDESLERLFSRITRYGLQSMPVVDSDGRLVGAVMTDEVIFRMFRDGRGKL